MLAQGARFLPPQTTGLLRVHEPRGSLRQASPPPVHPHPSLLPSRERGSDPQEGVHASVIPAEAGIQGGRQGRQARQSTPRMGRGSSLRRNDGVALRVHEPCGSLRHATPTRRFTLIPAFSPQGRGDQTPKRGYTPPSFQRRLESRAAARGGKRGNHARTGGEVPASAGTTGPHRERRGCTPSAIRVRTDICAFRHKAPLSPP